MTNVSIHRNPYETVFLDLRFLSAIYIADLAVNSQGQNTHRCVLLIKMYITKIVTIRHLQGFLVVLVPVL
jgi:hypothetical protein